MTGLYVVLGAAGVLLLWALANYNALVRLRNHCKESWADVDAELKRRYELIPNLVEAVKGYAKHERQVLEEVIQARSQALSSTGSPGSQAKDENALIGSLKHLLAVAEGYPDLKASQNFLQLQKELANTEDRIQAARRFYNANVRDLNTRVEVFPSTLIARMFNFAQKDYFQIEALELREAPKVELKQP